MIQQLLWFFRRTPVKPLSCTHASTQRPSTSRRNSSRRTTRAAGEASMLMPCNAMPCSHAMLSCSRACRPVARCPGQKHLDLCSGFMRAASARLAITRMCVIVDASSAIRCSVSINNHPASQARQDDRPPKCGAPADNAGVDPSGHFGSARACKRRAKEHRSDSSFSTSSRLCAWLSVLYRERNCGLPCPASHRACLCFANRGTPSFIPYMYVSRRTPAWNALYVCMYAVCNMQPAAARLLPRQPQAAIVGFSRPA